MADSYSRIKAACKFKSKSIDYSDFKFNAAVSNPNSLESDQNRPNRPRHGRLPEEDEEEEEQDEYGRVSASTATVSAAALTRNSSVSSSASGFQTAVKRAMSMRRSSSVSERYCRIHDQFAKLASPIDDDEIEGGDSKEGRKIEGSARRKMKKKKNAAGKIVSACKRLLGI